MKDLLKTWAPTVALAVGALGYWGIGTVSVLNAQVEAMQEQTKAIVIAATANCEALAEQFPAEEESEDASTPDTVKR